MDKELDKSEMADSGAGAETPRHRARRRATVFGALWRIAVAVLILGAAGYQVYSMIGDRPEPVQRQPRERSFTVSVVEPVLETAQPPIISYGEIVAARTIDIRSRVAGEVIEVSPDLEVGAEVAEGDVLLRVDSFEYDGQVTAAQASLADAQLSLSEAQSARALEDTALEVAREQLAAAERDLERARTLLERGSVTRQSVEQLELSVSQLSQALAQHENAIVTLDAQILRQRAAIETARWNLDQAKRAQANTVVTAPFTGVVTAAAVSEGGVVANNETLLSLYESASLNARFVISDRQYGQLVQDGLQGRAVEVVWEIEPRPVVLSGAIDRAGAQVDAASGGVEIYARLDTEAETAIRPGTFVEVRVTGLARENVLRLPETAIYNDERLYVVREGRMASVPAEVVARDGDEVLVRAAIADGERIVITRLAQAADGVRVTIEGEEPAEDAAGAGRLGGPPRGGQGRGGPPPG